MTAVDKFAILTLFLSFESGFTPALFFDFLVKDQYTCGMNTNTLERKTEQEEAEYQEKFKSIFGMSEAELNAQGGLTVDQVTEEFYKKIPFKPFFNFCLIYPIKEGHDRRVGSIYIPDSQTSPTREGICLAAGPGKELSDGSFLENPVKAGMHVLFSQYTQTHAEIMGQRFLLMSSANILGEITK